MRESDVEEIKASLVEIKTDLRYHIKRTDMIEDRFKPVEDHVKFIRSLMRLATWVAGIVAAAAAVIKVFHG